MSRRQLARGNRRGVAGGGFFPPTAIPGAVAFWDATRGLVLSGSNVVTAADQATGGTADTATGKATLEPQFVASDGGGPCFDMATGRVFNFTHSSDLNPTTAFTFSGWIKRPTTGVNHIFFSSSLAGAEKFRLIIDSGDAITAWTDGTVKLSNTYGVSTAWRHFALTYDGALGSQRFKWYLDGALTARGFDAEPAASLSASDKEVWGAYIDETTQPCNFKFAWLGIWNRALTLAEIVAAKGYQPRA